MKGRRLVRVTYAALETILRGPIRCSISDAPHDLRIVAIVPPNEYTHTTETLQLVCESEAWEPMPEGAMMPFEGFTFTPRGDCR